MSVIQLPAPTPFDFKQPNEWTRWKQRFQQYRGAPGLNEEAEECQVSTLLYCMGKDTGEVLATTTIFGWQLQEIQAVLKTFDEFLNVLLERARFNSCNQQPGETAEQYITALYGLVELCQYGALRNELLRERLVISIANQSLLERMQLKVDLTLEEAKKMTRQQEAVRDQRQKLCTSSDTKKNSILLDAVSGAGRL